MLTKEILKTVKAIEIKSGRLVNDIFGGQYESIFKGRGMEFSEVREYIPGDDIRSIDWNITARYGHPYVKKYTEERELTIMLVVDASGSAYFGTNEKMKFEIAAEISAVLAFSALKNNDKVGLLIFTDEIEEYIPPKKSKTHILRIIREILYFKPKGQKTNIAHALEYLNRVIRKKAIVFLISDFIDSGYEKMIRVTNKKHDLVAVNIKDPREKELPNIGLVKMQDAETGEDVVIDTSDDEHMSLFKSRQNKHAESLDAEFRKNRLDFIEISTHESYVKPLVNFFRSRSRRFR